MWLVLAQHLRFGPFRACQLRIKCSKLIAVDHLSCACASTLVPSDDTVIRAPQAHRSPAFVPAPVPVEGP